MEAKSEMGSVADVEKQQPLLSAAAAGEKPSSGCDCGTTASPPLATGALPAAFAAQLAARDEYVLLAVLASQVVSFGVFTSLLALCALPEGEEGKPRRIAGAPGARARVLLLWPFAMALPVSMACWAAESAPAAVGLALLVLALAAVLACYAEVVRSLWPRQ